MPKIHTNCSEERVLFPLELWRLPREHNGALLTNIIALPNLVRFEFGVFNGRTKLYVTLLTSSERPFSDCLQSLLSIAAEFVPLLHPSTD